MPASGASRRPPCRCSDVLPFCCKSGAGSRRTDARTITTSAGVHNCNATLQNPARDVAKNNYLAACKTLGRRHKPRKPEIHLRWESTELTGPTVVRRGRQGQSRLTSDSHSKCCSIYIAKLNCQSSVNAHCWLAHRWLIRESGVVTAESEMPWTPRVAVVEFVGGNFACGSWLIY